MEPTKKRILYVLTKSNWGGAQRYVYDLATALPKEEFDAEVIAGGNGLLKEKLEQAGVPVISLHTMERDINLKKELLSTKELWKIFREKKPDIVHLNSSKAGGLGALVARLAGVPLIIFTAHAWAFNENRGTLSKLTIGFLHWLTVMLSHRTIAVSDSVKEQVSHMPFMKDKIEVIHLGMEPFEYKSKEESRVMLKNLLEHPPLPQVPISESAKVLGTEEEVGAEGDDEIWIGTVSELHPVKGIPYAIDAIALLREEFPNLQFYIIGEGEHRALIERQIVKRRLESQVHLTGFIDEAKTYLKAFDIFILSSLSEAFGYSIVEAGLVGLPVVATEVGGIPEVVDEAGILVPPRNGRALADAIKKILNSPELKEKLSKELHSRIRSEFNITTMQKKTIDAYRKKR